MHRCNLCSDAFGELADLSCGDAWLPEYTAMDKRGTSVVIVRDTRGEALLASLSEALDLDPLDAEKAAASQRAALTAKKDRLRAKTRLASLAGRQTPTYQQDLPVPGLQDYASAGGQSLTRFLYRRWHGIRGYDS
jgi:coenzyme F420-reducing hydrogenase beta subunit